MGAPLRERAKFFFRRNVYNRMIGLRPRSDEPYCTHLPILCALVTTIEVRRVVEYGSGLISTPAFLDRSVFPRLESLLSFESDPSWYASVAESLGNDTRLQLRLTEGPIKAAVRNRDIAGADLIFVDDSDELGRRADTVTAIAACKPLAVPVVIHDIEQWHLFRAARRFEHMFRFDVLHPQTGVVWNGNWSQAELLPQINRLMKQHSGNVLGGDAKQWTLIFARST